MHRIAEIPEEVAGFGLQPGKQPPLLLQHVPRAFVARRVGRHVEPQRHGREALLERVVKLAGDPVPLLGGGFGLQLRFDEGQLRGNLAPQQYDPADGHGRHSRHRGQQGGQPPGLPPAWGPRNDDVACRPHEQFQSADDKRTSHLQPVVIFGGRKLDDASRLHRAARLDRLQLSEYVGLGDGREARRPRRQQHDASHPRPLQIDDLGRKRDKTALIVTGLGHLAGAGGVGVDSQDGVGGDGEGLRRLARRDATDSRLDERGEATANLDEPRHLDTIADGEAVDRLGLHPYPCRPILRVEKLPWIGKGDDAPGADPPAAERAIVTDGSKRHEGCVKGRAAGRVLD